MLLSSDTGHFDHIFDTITTDTIMLYETYKKKE